MTLRSSALQKNRFNQKASRSNFLFYRVIQTSGDSTYGHHALKRQLTNRWPIKANHDAFKLRARRRV